MSFWSKIFRKKERKIKVGLSLGSGGAKGFAELGAIKALEENGIEFDVVTGTSIGSIIGAFIADGYSSTDIYELLGRVEASEVASKLFIGMDTSGLRRVIDRSIGSKKIEELKKPFAAAVTDIDASDGKIFYEGEAAAVLCASAAYPPYFKPVVIDGVRYVDGAFFNSIPADAARNLGAEYVIGIDLSNHENKPNVIEKIFPTFRGGVKEPWKTGYDNCNVMIRPDLTGYGSISFSASREMYDAGYAAAEKVIDRIKTDLERMKKTTKRKDKKADGKK